MAASGVWAPKILWFDRFETRRGAIELAGDLVHTEDLTGEETLAFETRQRLAKGDRLLWYEEGFAREAIVVSWDRALGGLYRVVCEGPFSELLGDFVVEENLRNVTAEAALGRVLAPTRWDVGTVDDVGKDSLVLYHLNALAALWKVADTFGLEPEARVGLGTDNYLHRSVRLVKRRGGASGIRLVEGRDLISCEMAVLSDEVPTALYGFGAGLPSVDEAGKWTGGFQRKVTMASANDGQLWVGDGAARESWGRWNRNHTAKVHRYGQIVFPYCSVPSTLKSLTQEALAEISRPAVSYRAVMPALGRRLALGDEVALIAPSVTGEALVCGRVVRRTRSLMPGSTETLTLERARPNFYTASAKLAERVGEVERDAGTASDGLAAISSRLVEVPTAGEVEAVVQQAFDEAPDLGKVSF